jgi:hypothetical protein
MLYASPDRAVTDEGLQHSHRRAAMGEGDERLGAAARRIVRTARPARHGTAR